MLDTRQYPSDQPGDIPVDFGPQALGAANVTGTLTGPEQEACLVDGYARRQRCGTCSASR